jgi:hypothetical protein
VRRFQWMITQQQLMMSPKKSLWSETRLGCVGASYGGYLAFDFRQESHNKLPKLLLFSRRNFFLTLKVCNGLLKKCFTKWIEDRVLG